MHASRLHVHTMDRILTCALPYLRFLTCASLPADFHLPCMSLFMHVREACSPYMATQVTLMTCAITLHARSSAHPRPCSGSFACVTASVDLLHLCGGCAGGGGVAVVPHNVRVPCQQHLPADTLLHRC